MHRKFRCENRIRHPIEQLEKRFVFATFFPFELSIGSDAQVLTDVSTDGSFVVGHMGNGASLSSYLWSDKSRLIDENRSERLLVLDNGDVIRRANDGTIAKWQRNIGWTPQPESLSRVENVSADGKTFIGVTGDQQAAAWTSVDGQKLLGSVNGYSNSQPRVLSRDGGVIAGFLLGKPTVIYNPFVWTKGGGMVSICDDACGGGLFPSGISANGNFVLGGGNYAFVWTQTAGLNKLTAAASAESITDSGRTIVGNSFGTSQGIIWLEDRKPILFNDYAFSTLGLQSTKGWNLLPRFISPDGAMIVGAGTDPQGRDRIWRITKEPEPITKANATGLVIDGENATLTWLVSGTPPLSGIRVEMFWSENASFEEGVDRVAYTYPNAGLQQVGEYKVSISTRDLARPEVHAKYLVLVVSTESIDSGREEKSEVSLAIETPEQFEFLAREVAYQDWNIGDKVQTKDFRSDFEVSYVLSQPFNGLFVLGLSSPTFGPALVFRGSAQVRDFFDDTDPNGVGYSQFSYAATGTLEWVLHQNSPVDLTGHSLGGALAQWFAAYIAKLGGVVDNVITFNSPGISNSRDLYPGLRVYADEFSRQKSVGRLGVQHYVSSGDIVSLAGERFIDGDVLIAYSDETDSPLDLHTLPILVPRTWDQSSGSFRLRPADLTWRSLISSNLFSEPTYEYDRDVDRLFSYVGSSLFVRAVVDTTNQAASDLLLIPTKLRFRSGVESLRRNSREILAELFSSVVTVKIADKSIKYLLDLTSNALERLELVVGPPNSVTIDGDELEFQLGTKPAIRGRTDVVFPTYMGGSFKSEYIVQATDVTSRGSFTRQAIKSEGEFSVLGKFATVTGASSFDFNTGTMSLLGRLSILNGLVIDLNAKGRANANGDFAFGNNSATINFPNTTLVPSYLRDLRLDDGNYLVEFTNDGNYSNDFVSIWGTVGGEVYAFEAYMNGTVSLLGPLQIPPVANQGGGEGPGSFKYVFPDNTVGAIVVAEWPTGVQRPVLQVRSVNGETILDTTAGTGSNYIAADLTNANRVVVKFPVNGDAIQVSSSDDRVGLSVFAKRIAEPPQFSTVASADGVTIVPIDQIPLGHTGWMYRRVGQQSMLPANISVLPNFSLKWNTSGIATGSYELAVYDRAPGSGRVLSKWLLVDVESPKPKLLQLNVPVSPIPHNASFEVSASVANSSSFAELQVSLDGRFVARDIFGWNGWSTKLDAEGLVGVHTVTAALVNSNGVMVDQITNSIFFAGPSYWQNPVNHLDTNYDGFVTAIDALLIINLLNRSNGGGQVTVLESLVEKFTFLDANGDDHYTPLDALLVINRLNDPQAVGGEGERQIESNTNARDLIFAELDGLVDEDTKKAWTAVFKRRHFSPTVRSKIV